MLNINYKIFKEHGGHIDNSDFAIMKCGKCGIFAIYDNEHYFLYYNPKDLKKQVLHGLNISHSFPCPKCNNIDSFDEISSQDNKEIIETEWNYLFEK